MIELKKLNWIFIFTILLILSLSVLSGQLAQQSQSKKIISHLDTKLQDLQDKLTCPPAQVASERIMVVNNTVNVPVEPAPKPEVTCPVVNKKDCLQDYGYIGDVGIVSVTVICSDGSEKKVLCSDVKA